jgi:serine/threonine protein phosphatase 1
LGLKSILGRKKRRTRRLPEGVRVYAIGDVHGRADLLEKVFLRIDTHETHRPSVRPVHVLIGDYIDRGPASREVIELLIRRAANHEVVCLKGNHETLLLDFLKNPASLRDWSMVGGRETLMSYGLTPPLKPQAATLKELAEAFRSALPAEHVRFLHALQTSFACGDFFFVHAGVRPGIPLAKQKENDLLWIRDDFLLHEEDFGKLIVHGHTPVRELDIHPNRINIDTGAFATGRLTCLVIEADRFEPL